MEEMNEKELEVLDIIDEDTDLSCIESKSNLGEVIACAVGTGIMILAVIGVQNLIRKRAKKKNELAVDDDITEE